MKIDCHSLCVGAMMSLDFWDAFEPFAKELAKEEAKIKTVQLYSDFYLPDQTYPFVDEEWIYYPVTLIYGKKDWKTQWIRWRREHLKKVVMVTDLQNHRKESGYFSPFWVDKTVVFEKCSHVPEQFSHSIVGKRLCFVQDPHEPVPVVFDGVWKNRGKINDAFVEEMVHQVSSQLRKMAGRGLSSRWEIRLSLKDPTVIKQGWHYRCVQLMTYYVECMDVGVCWKEPYDIGDAVKSGDVTFFLTEEQFGHHPVATFSSLTDFIKNEGFDKKDTAQVHCHYPDVEIRIQLKEKVQDDIKAAIMNSVTEFVVTWNNTHEDEKIHDFFLMDQTSDYRVSVFVDFGDCDPIALAELTDILKKKKFGKVSLQ